MLKTVKIERGNVTRYTQVRQLAHDDVVTVGSKIKFGSGARWLVTEVR